MKHIVDILIEERATELKQRPWLWPFIKQFVYPVLGYDRALEMADTIAPMSGAQVFEHLSRSLALRVDVAGRERIPARGLAVVTPNHPAGIADGIAVYDALRPIRDDITFFANRDALRVSPGMADMVVPVEWNIDKRTLDKQRVTVKHIVEAFRQERLIVIFPSGRLAQPTIRGLVERPWQPTALNLAQKYGAPVLPMHIRGVNSALFYFFWFVNTELRDMALFRELLNKRGQKYRIRIGDAFEPAGEVKALTESLQAFVERDLPAGGQRFEPPVVEHDVPGSAANTPSPSVAGRL